jgi:hypothetical protein
MHNKAPEKSSTFATTIQLYPLAVNVEGENILPAIKTKPQNIYQFSKSTATAHQLMP